MTPKLTPEMREALLEKTGQPVTVEDEQTQIRYVLLPLNVYQRVQSIFTDEHFDVAETYAAQSEVAGRAGWDDQAMDVYDDYDTHHQKS
jgi:hypothetical protein